MMFSCATRSTRECLFVCDCMQMCQIPPNHDKAKGNREKTRLAKGCQTLMDWLVATVYVSSSYLQKSSMQKFRAEQLRVVRNSTAHMNLSEISG